MGTLPKHAAREAREQRIAGPKYGRQSWLFAVWRHPELKARTNIFSPTGPHPEDRFTRCRCNRLSGAEPETRTFSSRARTEARALSLARSTASYLIQGSRAPAPAARSAGHRRVIAPENGEQLWNRPLRQRHGRSFAIRRDHHQLSAADLQRDLKDRGVRPARGPVRNDITAGDDSGRGSPIIPATKRISKPRSACSRKSIALDPRFGLPAPISPPSWCRDRVRMDQSPEKCGPRRWILGGKQRQARSALSLPSRLSPICHAVEGHLRGGHGLPRIGGRLTSDDCVNMGARGVLGLLIFLHRRTSQAIE